MPEEYLVNDSKMIYRLVRPIAMFYRRGFTWVSDVYVYACISM